MERLRKLIKEVLSTPPKQDSCNCGCHSCENVGNPGVVLNESIVKKNILSENLRYHVDNKLPLTENTFRYGSEAFLNLWAEARSLYLREIIHVNEDDKEILEETDLGNFGLYEGVKVPLDLPMEDNPYESILEDIKTYGRIYESVNIENSYKLEDIKSDNVSISFLFKDKHGIERKLQLFKGNSVKLLWFNPSIQEWTTERIPSKYEDEKVMNTFGMILIKLVLPKYGSFNFKALNAARYRLFRALIYNSLDTTKYEMDFNDKTMEIEVASKETLNEEKKKKLNKPMRDSSGGKAYKVYVKDPKTKKIKTVRFGSGGLKAKINNPKARQAFAKRHKCGTGEPKTSARYWSCRLPRFSKLLGLKGSFSGFW
jgi:hypothetical protein